MLVGSNQARYERLCLVTGTKLIYIIILRKIRLKISVSKRERGGGWKHTCILYNINYFSTKYKYRTVIRSPPLRGVDYC